MQSRNRDQRKRRQGSDPINRFFHRTFSFKLLWELKGNSFIPSRLALDIGIVLQELPVNAAVSKPARSHLLA
jgi:hypothetical protein